MDYYQDLGKKQPVTETAFYLASGVRGGFISSYSIVMMA